MTEKFRFKTADNTPIYTYRWLPEKSIQRVGIVQIVHGMDEHAGRYEDFAQMLNQHGYIVYGSDHRGHGKTAVKEEDKGFLSEKNGWEKVVADLKELTDIIREEYDYLPLFVFGHSMGSLLVRDYISAHGEEIEGVILSGTSGSTGIMGYIGYLIALLETLIRGKRSRSHLMHNLVFGGYNKHFKPERTGFDWLSRDKKEVDKYISDSDCGSIFTANFYKNLLYGNRKVNKISAFKNTPEKLPIYLLAGKEDPVGNKGQGIIEVYEKYVECGMKNIEYKLYPRARHEILNEINREEVYRDIVYWLNKNNNMIN